MEMSWYGMWGKGDANAKSISLGRCWNAAFSIAFYFYIDALFIKKWPQTPFLGHFCLLYCLVKQTTSYLKPNPTLIINPSQNCINPTAPDGGGRRRKPGWLLWLSMVMPLLHFCLRSGERWQIERATKILWHIFPKLSSESLYALSGDDGIQESLNRASQIMVTTLVFHFLLFKCLVWDRMDSSMYAF